MPRRHHIFRLLAAVATICLPPSAVSAQTLPDPTRAQAPGQNPGAAPSPYIRSAPTGAPNVVVVLLDDVSFGSTSTFGGPIATPALEALAKDGLRYNRFHTTAICSPTRASLLTGHNAHAAGMGAVVNAADGRPGYSGFQRADTASIAEILRQNGYATGAFGKWHQTPDWEASPAGPFDRWPTGQGFEKFYGFMGGETDQFDPTLHDGITPIMRPPGDNYHLTEDLVDQSIKWLHAVRGSASNKPFFLYLAPGATHAPLQVRDKWIEPYRGKFDQGWDKLREEILNREKRIGVVPRNTDLTPRPAIMPAWTSLTPEQQRFSARLMETYAGFLAHTDAQVGRLVQALKDSGEYDNTLFIYIVGDNGGSGEGGLGGSLNYQGPLTGTPEPDSEKLPRVEEIGGPHGNAQLNAGWSWALAAPFQWVKTVASHLGATRNPMVISWPQRIKDRGDLRSQFGHVNDIAPTILEAAGIPAPATLNGVRQRPMDGISLSYTFSAADAPERHRVQYFEVFGHRAIYKDGWMASAVRDRLPWTGRAIGKRPMDQDRWELYDLRSDFSQAHDQAERRPDKLKELQAAFIKEATANQVLPLEPPMPPKSGLPDPSGGASRMTYREGAIGIAESAVPSVLNRSWALETKLTVQTQASGVLAALGGRSAGFSLYLDESGRPIFTYRVYNRSRIDLASTLPLSPGDHVIKMAFSYDGGGRGKGGVATLSIDGAEVARGQLTATPTVMFSIDETFAVGLDSGAPVGRYPALAAPGYPLKGARVHHVTIDTGEREERLQGKDR